MLNILEKWILIFFTYSLNLYWSFVVKCIFCTFLSFILWTLFFFYFVHPFVYNFFIPIQFKFCILRITILYLCKSISVYFDSKYNWSIVKIIGVIFFKLPQNIKWESTIYLVVYFEISFHQKYTAVKDWWIWLNLKI